MVQNKANTQTPRFAAETLLAPGVPAATPETPTTMKTHTSKTEHWLVIPLSKKIISG